MGAGAADLVDVGEVEGLVLKAVHAAQPVDDAEGPASVAGAVVGGEHDDGVVELAGLLDVVDEAADLDVGVVKHGREGFLQPARDELLVGREAVPGGNIRVARGQDRVLGHDAHRLLSLEPLLAGHVVALIEAAAVLVEVLRGSLVGVVAGAEGDVEEVRLLLVDGPLVADELDRAVDHVLADVVVRGVGGGDAVVVVGELGGELVGEGVEEAVVTVEALLQGPVVERSRRGRFRHGGEVPLADREGGEAAVPKQLGDGCRAICDGPAAVGVGAGPVGDGTHAHGVVVAPGEEAGAGGGAEGSGVVVGVAQAIGREAVHVRGVDGGAIAAELGETDVVEDDVDDVGDPAEVGAFGPRCGELGSFEAGVACEFGGVRHGSSSGRAAGTSNRSGLLIATPPPVLDRSAARRNGLQVPGPGPRRRRARRTRGRYAAR